MLALRHSAIRRADALISDARVLRQTVVKPNLLRDKIERNGFTVWQQRKACGEQDCGNRWARSLPHQVA